MSVHSSPIGLIGIGLLGSALAQRLLARGFSLWGHDIDADRLRAFREQGGNVSAAAEVMARCERIVLCLPSHKEVNAFLAEHAGALRSGQILMDTTTGDPANSERIALGLAARGIVYLDATVSGSSRQVREGAAVLMVGGDAVAVKACAEVFDALTTETFHTGPAGSGAKMKLVTNLVLGLNRAVLAEGLAYAEALRLDLPLTLAVMQSSPAYSRAMDVKGQKMLRGDFTPEARLSQHLKDVRLIVDSGTMAGLTMPFSRTHRRILEEAEAAGWGEMDNSSIIQVLRGTLSKEDSR